MKNSSAGKNKIQNQDQKTNGPTCLLLHQRIERNGKLLNIHRYMHRPTFSSDSPHSTNTG